MPDIKPEQITAGFMQALRVLGQYIAVQRAWGWEVYAAFELLKNDVGIGPPGVAPHGNEAGALAFFGMLAAKLRGGEELTPNDINQMPNKTNLANDYLRRAFDGLTLDFSTFAPGDIQDVANTTLEEKINELVDATVEGPDPLDEIEIAQQRDDHYWDNHITLLQVDTELEQLEETFSFRNPPLAEDLYQAIAGRDLHVPDPHGAEG